MRTQLSKPSPPSSATTGLEGRVADPCESCGRPRAESYDAWVNSKDTCGYTPVLTETYWATKSDCDRATIAKLRGELDAARARIAELEAGIERKGRDGMLYWARELLERKADGH